MNPLYFGTSDAPLYGVYHSPKSAIGRRVGVVLCYPFGQEYMRSHRAFRQMALLLSKAGFHVFRFDYFGTGDSTGKSDQFTISQSVSDTMSAIDEIRDMSDVETVVVIGLRLGGTVAARVAQARDDVSHLVLWDAIADGPQYLAELQTQDKSHPSERVDAHGVRQRDRHERSFGVMGYPVTVPFQIELAELHLRDEGAPRSQKSLVMSNALTAEQNEIGEWCGRGGSPADVLQVELPGRWDEVDNWGSAMIPQEAIRAIVGWTSAEAF